VGFQGENHKYFKMPELREVEGVRQKGVTAGKVGLGNRIRILTRSLLAGKLWGAITMRMRTRHYIWFI